MERPPPQKKPPRVPRVGGNDYTARGLAADTAATVCSALCALELAARQTGSPTSHRPNDSRGSTFTCLLASPSPFPL